jgi:outer membrane protein OmpA-like peptidoglycan-associated protein
MTVALSACSDFNREAGSVVDEGAFGNPTMYNTMVMTGDRAMAIDLTRRFASEVPNTINFAFDSAQLDAQARAALDAQAGWIAQYPIVKFRVYGHTDLVGSAAYNKRLGLRRAQAAVNYLVSRGISRSRLEAVVSYGKTRPLVYTEGPDRRNRRTVTEVSGFIKPTKMVFDGKYMQRTYIQYLQSAREVHAPEE